MRRINQSILILWNLFCSFFSTFSFNFNPTTRHSVLAVIVGGFFYWSSLLCVNQSAVQKAMSLKSLSKARIALALSIFGLIAVFLCNFYTGLMMFAKYKDCDPLKSGQIEESDQLVPFYVIQSFHHIVAFVGIFVAGIFAASLGTVASCLASLSAVTIEDLMICGLNMKLTAEKRTTYAKWMNFGYGVFSFGLIFLIEGQSVLQATITLNGLIGGVILGLFLLGIFFKSANLRGALWGGILTLACVAVLGIFALMFNDEPEGLPISIDGCAVPSFAEIISSAPMKSSKIEIVDENTPWYIWIYKISYMYYSMIGTLLTIVFGLSISSISKIYDDWKFRKFIEITENRKSVETPNSQ